MELLCSLVSTLPEGLGWSEGRGGCVLCQPDLPWGQGKLLCHLSPIRQGREELAHFLGKEVVMTGWVFLPLMPAIRKV